MENVKLKTCSKCKTEYPATGEYFYKQKDKKDGLRCTCKICDKAYDKVNREKITERNRERLKAYYEVNREKVNERSKAYYEVNREKVKERSKAYLQTPRGKYVTWKHKVKYRLKKTIGCEPPDVLVEAKIIHLKTKKLCRTLSN